MDAEMQAVYCFWAGLSQGSLVQRELSRLAVTEGLFLAVLKSKLSTPAFSFAHVGPKEKAWQKENGREDVSPSADGEEGSAPSTCAHWRGGYGALTRGAYPFRAAA